MTPSLQEQHDDELVGLCYECVLDGSVWPILLNKLLAASGRQQGVLSLWENINGPQISPIFQVDPAAVAAFNDYYHRFDLAREYMSRDLNGIWFHDHESIGAAILNRHPFCQEFMLSFDVTRMSCLKLDGVGDFGSYLTILQEHSCTPPSTAEQQLLQRLAPHLLRAGRLSARMGALAREMQQRDALLDHSPTPVWLTDADGSLIHCNRTAEAVLRSPTSPLLARGQRLACPQRDTELRALLQRAADPGHAGMLPLDNDAGQQLLALPLAAHSPSNALFQRPLVMLVLLQKPKAPILAQLFNLTPAENRLAELLAQGLRPDECADALFVSINTVRSQLRTIFQKTGTTRQSELIGLIHRLAALAPAAQNHSNE